MGAFLRIEIFPSDLQRMINFYINVLRFKLIRNDGQYAFLQRDGIFIGANEHHAKGSIEVKREYGRPPTGVEIVIEVDDLQTERDQVVKAGWKLDDDIKLQFWGLRDFRLLDPDGYYLRVTEHSASRSEGDEAEK